jgi:integrase
MGEIFQEHWNRLRIEKHPGLEQGLVFATRSSEDPDVAALRFPSSWQKCLPKWLEAAGIAKHITPHSFRRTNVDALRWAKVEPVVARSLVGHATPSMTETYSTVVDDEKRDAVARVADLMGVGASGG